MSDTPTKVYVTKYALTAGIQECTLIKVDDSGYAQVKWPSGLNGWTLLGKHDWSPTIEEARARVKRMIDKKRLSLKKELAKYQEMAAENVPLKVVS